MTSDRPLIGDATATRLMAWIPVAAALAYPWSLAGFHDAIAMAHSPGLAGVWLVVAFALPLSGLVLASRMRFAAHAAARRLAFAALASPPLFVLTGVISGLLRSPVRDIWIWSLLWVGAGLAASLAPAGAARGDPAPPSARLRVLHGVAASIILLFVAFHLANHIAGLFGPQTHARVMAIGRTVYRRDVVEPVLVSLLLFQVASGVCMAWRWSARPLDFPRLLQVGSGAYLAAFILTHLNSAFVSARWIHGIQTDWGWATGAPEGLLMDAWNIRLLPHYALGVLFVLVHLVCGLRTVLAAHHVRERIVTIIFASGVIVASCASLVISAALCGVRL